MKNKSTYQTYRNDTGLPSVTTIIGPYIDKQWFTDEARDRGSAVHAACEAHLRGLYILPLNAAYQPYFDSFRRWADTTIDSVLLLEKRLSCTEIMHYCGQPDAIITLRGQSGAVLADWKTAQAYQKWWRVQGAAYRALAEIHGYETKRGLSVRIKNDGTGCLINEWSDYQNDFNIFVSLYNSYQFFNGEK